jgi:hypothetical protein
MLHCLQRRLIIIENTFSWQHVAASKWANFSISSVFDLRFG